MLSPYTFPLPPNRPCIIGLASCSSCAYSPTNPHNYLSPIHTLSCLNQCSLSVAIASFPSVTPNLPTPH
ncbi:hypothetical protein PAXRUDRAFT_684929 [Paxillus rubicundulus Ve08.2h10]|uniref:Unplaced genomic scaffold scaffold_70, whole genome shotgun sequence n=1 Tax=Paxillus rubicundulus Ve08.2h10 TaxID=930991 RepID=A0A0D0E8F7_9AGAM|nr:hypothetical protein PAXRUDRAFT_684929 [Paxillus rubicundulus Ve08.2h10]